MLDLFRSLFPIYFDGADDGGSGGKGDDGKGDDDKGDQGDPDPSLGDAGKKALDEERSARRAAEKQAKAATAELEKLKAGAMSEQEKAVATAKAEGRTEALAVANERLVRAAVTTAATGKITNPSLATRLLDLSDFEVDEHGELDEKAIARAIDALVKENPELANGTRKPGALPGAKGAAAAATQDMNAWMRDAAGVTPS